MPIYEYECLSCSVRFERKQGFHDEPIQVCPDCGSKVRKLIFPAGIIFKGSGFYKTDHGSGGIPPGPSSASDKSDESAEKAEKAKKAEKDRPDTAAPKSDTAAPKSDTATPKPDTATPKPAASESGKADSGTTTPPKAEAAKSDTKKSEK